MKFLTLANVALRSLFLEASWNTHGQQNLGLAASIDPALKLIHTRAEELLSARKRAAEFFNTNPIASGVAIGAIIKLEQDVAAGRLSAEDRMRRASYLARSLASLGDAFFWKSWLPFCALAAVWAYQSLGWWSPLLLPVLFCLLAVPTRFGGLFLGYRYGENVNDILDRLKIMHWAQGLQIVVGLMVGVSLVRLLNGRVTYFGISGLGGLWLTMAAITGCILIFRFFSRRSRQWNHWYPLIILFAAVVATMFFVNKI